MTPYHPDLGDPEALAIATLAIATENNRMAPCDCNHEMGDRCARCAPTSIVPPKVGDRWGDLSPEQRAMVPDGSLLHFAEERETCEKEHGSWPYEAMHDNNVIVRLGPAPTATPEPDRSGWPVLVKGGRDWWWESGDAAITDCGDGTWSAWPACSTDRLGWFPSADLAAEALGARLPDETPERKEAPNPALWDANVPVDFGPLVPSPDPRGVSAAEIADLRSQVEAFRRAACVALGYGENTTPGDSTLLRDLRAMDIKNLRERAESAEATLDAYRIQRDQAREDAAGVRRLLNDAAALRAAAAEACDCDDGEVPADAELARRLRELDTDDERDLAVVRDVIGTCTESIRKLVCEGRGDATAIAITGLCAVIERVVGVPRG